MEAAKEQRGWRYRFARAVRADGSRRPPTELLRVVPLERAMHVLDLTMRLAEAMLQSGASSNDVAVTAHRVTSTYGLRPVHVDVTFNSIAVSYYRGDEHDPLTLVRVVRSQVTDHGKLERIHALLLAIDAGLELEQARLRFTAIRRTPFGYTPLVVTLAQGLLSVGVCIMLGSGWLIAVLGFVVAIIAWLSMRTLGRAHVPPFFTQILGAFVVTLAAVGIAALGAAGVQPLAHVRPALIIVAGIILMLAGLSVVGAAQDAIDGFSLTAGGRILELFLMTLGIVIGIVGGLSVGVRFGVRIEASDAAPIFGEWWQQLAGAVVVAVAVALVNGASGRVVLLSALFGTLGVGGLLIGGLAGLSTPVASGLGALIGGFGAILVGHRGHVPSLALATAAIVPLVPGLAVYRGLLTIVESEGSASGLVEGAALLVGAAAVGIALATGVSLGTFLGTPIRDRVANFRRRQGRVH